MLHKRLIKKPVAKIADTLLENGKVLGTRTTLGVATTDVILNHRKYKIVKINDKLFAVVCGKWTSKRAA